VAADFSETANPNSPWAFGWTDSGGVFKAFPSIGDWYAGYHTGGSIYAWYDYNAFPMVGHSHTGSVVTIWGRCLPLPVTQVAMGPGAPATGRDAPAVVKWTAASGGIYTISAQFTQLDWSSATGVAVYTTSGSVNWTAALTGTGSSASTAQTIAMAGGESVSFVCNKGSDGTNAYDTVGLVATVTQIAGKGLVTGLITDSVSGSPISGATVQTLDGSVSTTSGSNGRYTLLLDAGTPAIRVSNDGYTTQQRGITLAEGQAITENFVLARAITGVAGTVKTSDATPWPGKPLEGATVEVLGGGASATTDANGAYQMELTPGTYNIKASKGDYQDVILNNVVITAGNLQTRHFELGLTPGKCIWDAAFEYSETVNPTPTWEYGYLGYDIELYHTFAHGGTWQQSDVWAWSPTSDGVPAIGHTHTGQQVSLLGTIAAKPGQLFFVPTAGMALATWTAPAAATYTVRAAFEGIDPNGAGTTSGAKVYCSNLSILDWSQSINGFGATASVTQDVTLTKGQTISFGVNDGDNYEGSNDTTGLSAQIILNLTGQGVVKGKVVNAASTPWPGQPIAGATVQSGSVSTTTDANGDYFLILGSGSRTLDVSKSGYTTLHASVTVPDGTWLNYDLELSLAKAVIQGTVTNAASTAWPGKAISGATVQAGSASTTTNSAGHYELLLDAGTYTLQISKDPYQTYSETGIVIPAGGSVTRDVAMALPLGVWDVALDFSESNNPSHQWEYGKIDYVTRQFSTQAAAADWYGSYHTGGSINGWGGWPEVGHSHTGSTVVMWGRATLTPRMVAMNPWSTASAAVRWTAPRAGTYRIDARFDAIDYDTVGVYVHSDGGGINTSASLNSQGENNVVGQSVVLAAGEKVYFEVDSGPSHEPSYDTTGLTVTIRLENPFAVVQGTVTNAASTPWPGKPIWGAVVQVGATSTTTNSQGQYQLLADAGTHTLQVSQDPYQTYTETGLVLAAGGTVTRNVAMSVPQGVWDVALDFSETNNPFRHWEYGQIDYVTRQFTLMAATADWYAGQHTGGSIYGWGGWPVVGHSHTGDPVAIFGRATLTPRMVVVSPGTFSSAAVRWTAPYPGSYRVDARFDAIDFCTVGVHARSDGGGINSSALLNAQGQSSVVGQVVQLAAGELVCFEVDYGSNQELSNDTTGLTATIRLQQATFPTIAALKGAVDGTPVQLTDAKIATCATGTFTGGGLYLEEPGRTSGVKIVPRAGLQVISRGDRVKVTGIMATDANGERYLDVTSIDSRVSGTELVALGLNNKSFALTSAPGKDGLLVTIWGHVAYDDPAGSFIYVDDGSGVSDGNAAGRIGVKVVLGDSGITKVINATDYVSVRGVVGLGRDGTTTISVVRPRDNADISIQ